MSFLSCRIHANTNVYLGSAHDDDGNGAYNDGDVDGRDGDLFVCK